MKVNSIISLIKAFFYTFIAVVITGTDSKHRCNGEMLSKRGTNLVPQQSIPTGHGTSGIGNIFVPTTHQSYRSSTRSDRPPELPKSYSIKPQKLSSVQYEEDKSGILQSFSRKRKAGTDAKDGQRSDLKKVKLGNNDNNPGSQTGVGHSTYPYGSASKSTNGERYAKVASKAVLAAGLTGMKKYDSVREAYKDVKQKCIGACQNAYHSGRTFYSKLMGNTGDQKKNGELTYKQHVERDNKKHQSYNLWRSSKKEILRNPIRKESIKDAKRLSRSISMPTTSTKQRSGSLLRSNTIQ